MEQKKCTDCRVSKDLDKFTNENRTCNSCLERSRRKRERNPEKERERHQNYLANNRERVREKQKKNTEKCMTKLTKNAKYVNALTRKPYSSKHKKTKMHLANLEKWKQKITKYLDTFILTN